MAGALVRVGKSKVVKNTLETLIRRAIAAAKKAKGSLSAGEVRRIANKVKGQWQRSHGLSKKGSGAAIAGAGAVGFGAGYATGRSRKKKTKK